MENEKGTNKDNYFSENSVFKVSSITLGGIFAFFGIFHMIKSKSLILKNFENSLTKTSNIEKTINNLSNLKTTENLGSMTSISQIIKARNEISKNNSFRKSMLLDLNFFDFNKIFENFRSKNYFEKILSFAKENSIQRNMRNEIIYNFVQDDFQGKPKISEVVEKLNVKLSEKEIKSIETALKSKLTLLLNKLEAGFQHYLSNEYSNLDKDLSIDILTKSIKKDCARLSLEPQHRSTIQNILYATDFIRSIEFIAKLDYLKTDGVNFIETDLFQFITEMLFDFPILRKEVEMKSIPELTANPLAK